MQYDQTTEAICAINSYFVYKMSHSPQIFLFMLWDNLIEFYFLLFGRRGEGKKAADCLRTALKEYNLKFGTILNDPDLASFRVTPEFKELQEEVFHLHPCFFFACDDS